MLCMYLAMIETPEDEFKFEVVYNEYKSFMHHVAYKILKNDADAEDIVHSAFVKVAENMDKIGDPLSPRTRSYLVTITEHLAINLYNSKARHLEIPYSDEVMGLPYEYDGDNAVAACIAKLPARYKHIFELKYIQGFDNKDISKVMGISMANVRQLEKRARDRLAEICKLEGLV